MVCESVLDMRGVKKCCGGGSESQEQSVMGAATTTTPPSSLWSKKFKFSVAVDPNGQVKKKLKAQLMPTTILVGMDGSIIYRHQGYSPGDEDDILKHVTDHLDSEGIAYEPFTQENVRTIEKKKVDIDF